MQNDCLAREEIEEEERGSGKGKRRKGIFGLSPPPAPGGSKLPRISHLQISEESSGRAAPTVFFIFPQLNASIQYLEIAHAQS